MTTKSTASVIAEPALECCSFYLRQVEGESGAATQAHRAAFEQDLAALCAHLRGLSGQPVPAWEWPPLVDPGRIPSQIILHSGWLEHPDNGRCCLVSAGLYGDSYWMQAAYAQRGPADLTLFARLRDEAWHPAPSEHLLGESTLLCGIVAPEGGPHTDEAQKNLERETALRLLEIHLGGDPGPLHASRRADGRAGLYGSPEHPYVTALLYPDEAGEAWAGEHITTNITLRLELYKHKADRQLGWCEARLPEMAAQEQSLRGLLEQVHALLPAKATPANLQRLQELVRLYRLFNGNLGMLTDRHVTAGINLHNLEIVLAGLQPLAEDSLLGSLRSRLRGRHEQLDADFSRADQPRQQAERVIDALKVELALDRLLDPAPGPGEDGRGQIDRGGFPGAQSWSEADILLPKIETLPPIQLDGPAEDLLQQVYLGYKQVRVEKELERGYGGSRVFLTLPVTARDRKAALTVTKFGLARELRAERDNYERYVEPYLPFCVAPLRGGRYYERGQQAVLNYAYVGDGVLGRTTDLQSWFRRPAAGRAAPSAIALLDDLLDRELGQHWYAQSAQRELCLGVEYGQHLVEHLRLRLRPGHPDQLWRLDGPPPPDEAYTRLAVDDIPAAHERLRAGPLLSVEGLVVMRIKRDQLKLCNPDGRGIFVRVEFPPDDSVIAGLQAGDRVGVRGELLYNRRERLEQIARSAFPELSPVVSSPSITLPGLLGMLPNPLQLYPGLLQTRLPDRAHAYVHGDLHLRNVLVDERGLGWLIDFGRTGERHNLFDFIKLETYVRLMFLGGEHGAGSFSLREYARFEDDLTAFSLAGSGKKPPRRSWSALWPRRSHPQLAAASDLIRAIRRIARKYMAADADFLNEYLPALFLYCLAVTKYYDEDNPQPTRLAFVTAAVLGGYLGQAKK